MQVREVRASMKKWIAVYCSRDWTHAWIVEAKTSEEAESRARAEICGAFQSGDFGSAEVDEDFGEWIEIRPLAVTFLETTKD